MKRPRCPNGYRKNKIGECVKKNDGGIQPTKKKRCINGTRKNKLGECIPIDKNKTTTRRFRINTRLSSRTMYANEYFANSENIHLFSDPNKEVVLFQVNYNIDQFLNYKNLNKNRIKQPINCLFQSLFSLGLRNVKMSKHDSVNVNRHGKEGVSTLETAKYIHNAFDLTPQEVVDYKSVDIRYNKDGNPNTSKSIDKKIEKFFNKNLENGYATIIFIKYIPQSLNTPLAHAFIVYKYEDEIYFFDPSSKGVRSQNNVYTKRITDVIDANVNIITHYFYCRIRNLKTPKPLINNYCPITYQD